jgi:hypothetical protein
MTADMSASQTPATSSISAASLMSALKRIGWASEVSEMTGCRGLAMGLGLGIASRLDRLTVRAIFVGVEKMQARDAESLFDGYGHAGGPFKLTIHVVVGSPQAAPRCLGHLFGGDMYFHAKFVGHFASKFKR